jgi:response regulator RpfG family c-di-GMP phosphodiesterase
MPGMKGDEFLYIMHQKSRKTLSILLTGQADAEAVGRALNRAKLYRYISKPWEEPDLVLTIKEALRSYLQGSTIEEQKLELEKFVVKLKEHNETLEQKVMERTSELFSKNEIL